MFVIKQREDEDFKPVLARRDGDPPGTPGISIFVVPKYHVNPDGSIGKPNDVTTTGIEHKMGIRDAATCLLSLKQEIEFRARIPLERVILPPCQLSNIPMFAECCCG